MANFSDSIRVSDAYVFREKTVQSSFDITEDLTNPVLPVTLSGLQFTPEGLQPVNNPVTGPLFAIFTVPGLTAFKITTFYKRLSYAAMGVTGPIGNHRLVIRTAGIQVNGIHVYGAALCMNGTSEGRIVAGSGTFCPGVPPVAPLIPPEPLDTDELLNYTLTVNRNDVNYQAEHNDFVSLGFASQFANVNKVVLSLTNNCTCSIGSSFPGTFTARFIGFGINVL